MKKSVDSATPEIIIGIIGGSGLDDPQLLVDFKEIALETPYGQPSSVVTVGRLGNAKVAILSRHGKDHSIVPTKVPYRANLWALKEVGCTHILATTACGSLREEIRPGDFVFPDQFIDNTKHRPLTLFEDQVIHTAMADPFCPMLRALLMRAATTMQLRHHPNGTIVTIEGPRFSTRAESKMFQSWGADVINMSTVPEVTLARELGLCYQTIAMTTDYDCWKEGEEPVTWEIICERMQQNAERVKQLIFAVVPTVDRIDQTCRATTELKIE
ncbi:MAG: S-methyl-5'-thioadenosine phosphorylase [Patescibacteria group bacterium]|nr:S-methyl-5'-thioadenosine phosphorylase [Patescibacteria group bacterium]